MGEATVGSVGGCVTGIDCIMSRSRFFIADWQEISEFCWMLDDSCCPMQGVNGRGRITLCGQIGNILGLTAMTADILRPTRRVAGSRLQIVVG